MTFDKCNGCGVAGAPICWNCFIGRPFERDLVCNVCGEQKPIVRLYLDVGGACDGCRPAEQGGPRTQGEAP